MAYLTSLLFAAALLCDPGYPVDVAASGEQLFVADREPPAVWRKTSDGWLPVAESHAFGAPRAIAADGDVLFVADTQLRTVWRVADGTTEFAAVQTPVAMAVAGGHLWIADALTQTVQAVRIADGTAVASLRWRGVRGLAADGDAVLALDADGHVAKLTLDRSTIDRTDLFTVELEYPADLVADAGRIAISDSYGGQVVFFSRDGKPTGQPITDGLDYPVGLALDARGLHVADSHAVSVATFEWPEN